MSNKCRSTEDAFLYPSFSLLNRFARVCWTVCCTLLFRLSPRPCHAWRAFLLRLFGAKVGRGAHVYPGAKIWAPWNVEIGDETGIADGATLYSQGKIRIGNRAVVSQGVHLCAGTHDYTHPGFPLLTKPITVGYQVWIATEAFVHAGVTIGEGAVIGARSVVTKDMPPWMVCAGNPCRPLKPRLMQSSKTN